MKKYLYCIVFIMAVIVSFMPVSAARAEILFEDNVDSVTFTIDSDEILTISGTGGFDYYNMNDNYSFKEIIVEDGITELGRITSKNKSSCKKITIAPSVKVIKTSAFEGYGKLESIVFSEGLEEIGNRAFRNCHIRELIFPESVKTIGDEAFRNNYSLKTVTITGDGVSIGNCAFTGTISCLSEINLPKNVKSIGFSAFSDANIEKITLPENLTKISNGMFTGCYNLKEIVIPDSVESIGNNAFRLCKSLENVQMGTGVSYIGPSAFGYCENLREIKINSQLKEIGEYAFAHCPLQSFEMPDSVTTVGRFAFNQDNALKSIKLSDNLTVIPESFCSICESLEDVVFPKNLIEIDENAFATCKALKEVHIPESVKLIKHSAFSNCRGIEKIYVPKDATLEGDPFWLFKDTSKIYVAPNSAALKSVQEYKHNYVLRDDLSDHQIELSFRKAVYTGKKIIPEVIADNLDEGRDYKLEYVNNIKCGDAKVILSGFDDTCGKVELLYTITPKKAKKPKVTVGKERVTVQMSAKASAYGGTRYQVKIREKGKKSWYVTEGVITKKTFSGRLVNFLKLKKGKKYEVKVRAYVKNGKQYTYGKWSDTVVTSRLK